LPALAVAFNGTLSPTQKARDRSTPPRSIFSGAANDPRRFTLAILRAAKDSAVWFRQSALFATRERPVKRASRRTTLMKIAADCHAAHMRLSIRAARPESCIHSGHPARDGVPAPSYPAARADPLSRQPTSARAPSGPRHGGSISHDFLCSGRLCPLCSPTIYAGPRRRSLASRHLWFVRSNVSGPAPPPGSHLVGERSALPIHKRQRRPAGPPCKDRQVYPAAPFPLRQPRPVVTSHRRISL
jgi:hypothetical protein